MAEKMMSQETFSRLDGLEKDLEDGELTKKGYNRRKWDLVKPYLEKTTRLLVEALRIRPITDDYTEADMEDAIFAVLKIAKVRTNEAPQTNGVSGGEHEGDTKPSSSGKTLSSARTNGGPSSTPEEGNGDTKPSSSGKTLSPARTNGGPSSTPEEGNGDAKPSSSGKTLSSARTNGGPSSTPEERDGDAEAASSSKPSPPQSTVHSARLANGYSTHEPDDVVAAESSSSKCSSPKGENGNGLDEEKPDISSLTGRMKRKTRSDSVQKIKSDPDSPPRKKGRGRPQKVKKERDDSDNDAEPKKRRRRQSKIKQEEQEIGNDRCKDCRQFLDDPNLRTLEGHPNHAVEEFIALTDPKLTDYGDDGAPQNKLTQFSIYDEHGHLCPLDGGILERNINLYVTGYIKPAYEEDPSANDGVAVKDLGPLTQWWLGGYDGGEKALIGVSSEYAEYFLMEPAPQYQPLMEVLYEKIYLAKLVVEFLVKEDQADYEDLLNMIQTTVTPPGIPKITEDSLIRHAQFVCDQVTSYEEAGDEDEEGTLMTAPCMRNLISLGGAVSKRGVVGRRQAVVKREKGAKDQWTKATTTPLVNGIFDALFSDQLATTKDEKFKGPKKLRCGVCSTCQLPDCGACVHCKDMVKFGGTGKNKQGCAKRRCPNMAVKDALNSDSETEVEDFPVNSEIVKKPKSRGLVETRKKVEWVGKPELTEADRTYYRTAKIADEVVNVGDFISCEAVEETVPVVIGRIQYMWETCMKKKVMHLYLFARGSETILGESADPQELFLVDECEKTGLNSVIEKVTVHKKEVSPNWKTEGGSEIELNPYEPKSFFYSKKYDAVRGRFEDLPPEIGAADDRKYCPACASSKLKAEFDNPCLSEPLNEPAANKKAEYGVLTWRGEKYGKGQCVYLAPDTFKFRKPTKSKLIPQADTDLDDEEKYPEMYRRVEDHRATEEKAMPSPFCIGLISAIYASKVGKVSPSNVTLKVYKFYRPENTRGIISDLSQHDLTKLYASEEEVEVEFSRVKGRCYAVFKDNIVNGDPCTWSVEGPDRFYFSEAYDDKTGETMEPLRAFTSLGNVGKGGGRVKGKAVKHTVDIPSFPNVPRPLRCLDVFAGCGGLSDGLHQSKVAVTKWAIEKEESAAAAFQINNPAATVLTDDCNDVLKHVISGMKKNNKGQDYPLKGEVELLVGGPPCQGFSGMNRFNQREYSAFKNSLIVTFLSFCDYYRPRFFILENVRNFCSFKKGMVLKLTLRCLVQMGYQVTVGVLQAGHYGVPQTRRRVIILAAAPGEILPSYPEPRHVFNTKSGGLGISVDDKKIVNGCLYGTSAPLRSVTVYDAMSDLPEIKNGSSRLEISYNSEPVTHFQKLMRDKSAGAILRDHICKDMSELVVARMAHIPKTKNADWRNLPNIQVKLEDGTVCRKLMYTHHDTKNGKSSTGALRGVCSCATGGKCDPMDRQFNTLIPWCLPHTGNRHNHWAGLYGRLQWAEYFRTTVTNPEPMGKQGRVLHPTQDRVVSVRECARSQGFHDTYRFYGNVIDKHRQIGNAVPPPMGKAIGVEISKAICMNQQKEELVGEQKM